MPIAKPINTTTYFSEDEIKKHLQNVEYIIMATPAPDKFKETPIQFTIFLNTQENFPKEIRDAIFEKFLRENHIKNPQEVLSQPMPVGFSDGGQETPMPLLLIKPQDQQSIPHTTMYVFDFLADSDHYYEAKEEKLTGWTYSYDS
ncbi:hypothetical protein MNB_SM-3-225 [hydrothermal vent metagenome]|uniref:Uncharacterized protein n=1 Tax=hydrothermal vent metagenome TaxID=652676 RepID=A0A1W1D343_9ZZZZ